LQSLLDGLDLADKLHQSEFELILKIDK